MSHSMDRKTEAIQDWCANVAIERPDYARETFSSSAVDLEILDVCTESGQTRWDGYLSASHDANVFHTTSWGRVLHDTYGYRPYYLVGHGAHGSTTLLPMMEVRSVLTGNRAVSLPFSDHCPGVFVGPSAPAISLDNLAVIGKERGWRSIELRGGVAWSSHPSASYYKHVLTLATDTERLWDGMTGSHRRNIKRAVQENLEVETSGTATAMKQYYRLHCLTRKRYGLPPQPYAFFENIQKHFLKIGEGFIVLCSQQGRPIAGAVYLTYGKRAVYKFGGSDFAYQHLRANSLVMWEAIKRLAETGYDSLCFGRTDIEQDGLIRFKKSWGANEELLNYYCYDVEEHKFRGAGRGMVKRCEPYLEKLPISMLRVMGKVLYRHMG